MGDLTGKTVLLTGASGGFGREFMRQLLERDCKLVLTDLDAEALRQAASDVYANVGRGEILLVLGADLSSAEAITTLFESIPYPIDVLINNAGIGLVGRHDEVPQEMWERLMQVNLLAPMRLCRLFAPQMIERKSGHIVNIGSIASWTSDVGLTAYAASKFGLRGFSEGLADELREHGVQVSVVCPFYSRTPILESPRFGVYAEQYRPENVNLPVISNPADVVAAALKGIEAEKVVVFTDRIGRIIYRLNRYVPAVFNVLQRQSRRVR